MRTTLTLLVAVSLLAPALARADGAFPDELQVFAPHLEPNRIVLSTNYGLILSDDDGATWSFVCETAVDTMLVSTYGIGPSVLYAVSSTSLLTSADQGCSWAGLDLSSTGAALLTDVFGDLAADDHAFAIAFNNDNSYSLFAVTSGSPVNVYSTSTGILQGVEVAQSNPAVVYATSSVFSSGDVVVLLSTDGGGGWLPYDHSELSSYFAGIAGVDPVDAATVYFRLSPALGGGDALGVTHDSGQTIAILFTAPGSLSAFAVDVDHSWYAGDEANHLWYGASDGGITEGSGPSLRCLAARSGVVYGCGDAQTDGFILGVSTDHGGSFQPLVTSTSYQTATCEPVRAVCAVIDGGPPPDAGRLAADAGSLDAGHAPDAGAPDAGTEDAGPKAADAGSVIPKHDAGPADAGPRPIVDAGPTESSTASSSTSSGSTTGTASSARTSSAASGCSCSQSDAALTALASGVLLAARRRRRPAS